ncbi:hypothetical protein JCGZ_11578 [Jatropha curcas]|uniref:HPP transmembrane region domain-containing protein n=1 Tax=Jatropha curcas TaxID=180498 RepID=A0A067K531_JATCU|nr:uncharacterized protein LOC105640488 isoform X2 [Jatropha curcas]KDP31202.1 hypothetical protein JCGZ_11578 [Jatropha curcas]
MAESISSNHIPAPPANNNKKLAGKIAIITGGASGIGEATARLFADHGALMVVIADCQDQLGQQVATSIGAINVRGMAACVKYAARAMIEQRVRGSIVCTGSVAGSKGAMKRTDYVMSKHAVVGLVRSASAQLGVHGIRVNSVSPYGVATPMTVHAYEKSVEEIETQSRSINSISPFPESKKKAILDRARRFGFGFSTQRKRKQHNGVVASSNVAAPFWDSWKPEKSSPSPSFSDVIWPSAGAFAAMAILGKMDQILAPKGISMTVAPLGAVCTVLFANPSAPAARKYNVFMAQIGCAAIGVLAFSIFGPGWLARSAALAASIAFMTYTRSTHPPAASLPLLFIDGVKFHHLNFWFALFPGAAACIILCLIQEIVCYLKDNIKF